MAGLSRDVEDFVAPSHEPKIETRSVATSEKHSDINIHHGQDDDDLEFPTDEEKKTLRRVPDTIPLNTYRMSYFISFMEFYLRNAS